MATLAERLDRILVTLLALTENTKLKPKLVKPGVRLRRRDPYDRIETRVRGKVRTGARDVLRARRERKQRSARHSRKGTIKDQARQERERRKKKKAQK